MINRIIFGIFISISFQFNSQISTPLKFRSPLNIPLKLAANFGELRPNHFHMGVDFKTNGVEGLPLFAVEKGYVSRIKISPYGYGKVIYIDHPNGITSVYAHCSKFKGKIDSIVQQRQLEEESFEIEIYFTPNDIQVVKGEIIALSGNTGGSTAPHLHFELRDTETEAALNPLDYDFQIADHVPPVINSMKIYALTEEGFIINNKSKTIKINKRNNRYEIENNKVTIPSDFCSINGGIGFSFDVIDRFDGSNNSCGIYSSNLYQDEKLIFDQQMHEIVFEDSRFINTHMDYSEYIGHRRDYHKSFKTEFNPLTIYPSNLSGIIKAKPGDKIPFEYKVKDQKGNVSEISFDLVVETGTINNSEYFSESNYFLPSKSYNLVSENIQLTIPQYSFYEPTLKSLSLEEPFKFGDQKKAIQYPYVIKIKLPDGVKNKNQYYVSITNSGRTRALDSYVEGDWIVAKSTYLGIIELKKDTVGPTISPINFNGSNVNLKTGKLLWRIIESNTDIASYDFYLDGKWQVLEYESKGNYLFYEITGQLTKENKLKIIATDSAGNITIWEN